MYRAIFVVPFSNSRALEMFVESISLETDKEDVRSPFTGEEADQDESDQGGAFQLNCFSTMNTVYRQ